MKGGQECERGKAAATDGVRVGLIRMGGMRITGKAAEAALWMWKAADEGREEVRPEERKKAAALIYKGKGCRRDKKDWRGISLISVGAKAVARLLADRASEFNEAWLSGMKQEFRQGKGTVDTNTAVRRFMEEGRLRRKC